MLPIAIQLYSVRDDAAADMRGTLQKIREMGYDGVEFAGLHGHTAEEVRKMCQEIGLLPLSAHVPYDEMVADPEGVLGQYAAIGCRYVAIPYLMPEYRPGTPGFADVIRNAAMLGEVANRLGMTLLYHNHDFEFQKIDGKYALEVLYDTVPASLLQTELDVCWVRVGGEDVSGQRISDICRRAGVVLQNADAQIIHQRVEDELAFGCENFAFSPEKIGGCIEKACDRMTLCPQWGTRTLSGGQKQRLPPSQASATP